uniref:RWD domain-containing protein 3 n=1 Tax=Hucho hucho TaxID=62062 RepID=A0A4W5QQZ5_9TELE
MSELALDEMSVLSAIYCEKDEFELLEKSEKGFVFCIQMELEAATSERTLLSLLFQLPTEYPHCVPEISVSSEQLSRKQCQHIKQSLLEKASALEPEPMVYELLLWLQQNFTELTLNDQSQVKEVEEEGGEEETWIALFLIDHMRSKTKYIKTIEKWSSELGLTGRLFWGKLILVLLQGARRSIKEYIHLQRTVKVDVDSSGKRCKEKMMRVLCETQVSDLKRLRISSAFLYEFVS